MTEIAQKIRIFFERYPTQIFEKGEVMIQAGDKPAGIFYLVEGRVTQYDIAPNGNAVVVNAYAAGSFFPMSWAINGQTNAYFFEAATKVKVHQAPAGEAVAFLHANQDVTFDLLSRVYSGSDGLLRRMAHIIGGNTYTRLKFELLNAAYRFGQRQRNASILIPLNEDEVGRQGGMARETVSRHIQKLKSKGLLSVTRKGIILHDLARLENDLGDEL